MKYCVWHVDWQRMKLLKNMKYYKHTENLKKFSHFIQYFCQFKGFLGILMSLFCFDQLHFLWTAGPINEVL